MCLIIKIINAEDSANGLSVLQSCKDMELIV
jgi:hypothetical protein